MLSNKYSDLKLEAGADEAGRGCLSGPVTAAAVLFSYEQNSVFFKLYEKNLKRIDDSKKLSEKMRFELRPFIEQSATSFSVTHVEPVVIDKINILNASIKAMQESILKLSHQPEYVIIDGNAPFISRHGIQNTAGKIFSQEEIVFLKSLPTMSIVGGDTKYLSIAAASILAKTYRDEYMDNIHEEFSVYNWRKNKGYPTKEHREAIAKYGICKYHRLSFRLL